jgi:hypothetical protein
MSARMMIVPMTETAMDPRQPSRLVKKKNMLRIRAALAR